MLTLYFIVSTFAARSAMAQSSASVSGTVTDQSGAAVADARIVLRNPQTTREQSTLTSAGGTYAIVNIVPGTYSLVVTKQGFEKVEENNILLAVDQAATFNFTLMIGNVQQSVTVTAEATKVQSSSASLGTVISTTPVNDLPLNGRNFTELLELTPGVSRVSVSQNANAGQTAGNPIGQFTFPAVNGQRNRSNMFLLDGIVNIGGYTDTYNYQPVIDDIQEFKVQSYSDLSEYGQVLGGTVSVVTKSGTNVVHGSVWEFLRNSDLDARNFFLPTVNPLRQNQFGAAVGGPLYIPHVYNGKNKTFFYFTYEGFRQHQASGGLATTATAAQLGGDFSALTGVQIYNPYSTAPDPANPGQYTRSPFMCDGSGNPLAANASGIQAAGVACNKIPSSLLSPASLLYASYTFPAPNASGLPGGRNLIDTAPELLDSDSYSGRLDQAFGQHDMMFGRISTYTQPSLIPQDAYLIDSATLRGWNGTVHEVHTFGPTSVLEVYMGRDTGVNDILDLFNHAPTNFASAMEAAGFSSAYIGGYSGPSANVIPNIDVNNYLTGASDNNFQNLQFADTWEFGGAYDKIWGRHDIKVGGLVATNDFTMPIAAVTEEFDIPQTSNLEAPANTGNALASFLLGFPENAETRNVNEHEYGGWADGLYAQDKFQVNSRLTLNFGIRWDVAVWPIQGYLSNGQGYIGTMDLANGTYILAAQPPACSATQGAPCIPGGTLPANVVVTSNGNHALHNTDFGDFQGRFGAAYRLRDKTSVLLGYGRFYDTWNSTTQYEQNLAGTWPTVGLLNNNSLNTTTMTSNIGNPLSQGTGAVVDPAATPFNNATFYINPNFKTPHSDQWNLEVQQGFGANTVWSVLYAGSHDGKVDFGALQNTAEYAAPGTAAQVAARRMWPNIVPTKWDNSIENASYNSLQSTLRHATSNGLTYLLSYTWSKAIDEGCSDSFGAGCVNQNPYNLRGDRSVAAFDLTTMFSGSVVYKIPYGSGRQYGANSAIVNGFLGGWDVNAITSLTSGQPYSVTVSGNISNTGNTLVRADLIGSPTPATQTANEWINPASFTSPAADTFGTFPRDALRSQWYRDLDLSLFKNFPLHEKVELQFRVEAFNLTNTPIFAIPNTAVGNPAFGSVSSTVNTERQFQMSLKIQF